MMFGWLKGLFSEPTKNLNLSFAVVPCQYTPRGETIATDGFIWLVEILSEEREFVTKVQTYLYDKIGVTFGEIDPTGLRAVVKDWKDGRSFIRSKHHFIDHAMAEKELKIVRQYTRELMDEVSKLTYEDFIQGTKVV